MSFKIFKREQSIRNCNLLAIMKFPKLVFSLTTEAKDRREEKMWSKLITIWWDNRERELKMQIDLTAGVALKNKMYTFATCSLSGIFSLSSTREEKSWIIATWHDHLSFPNLFSSLFTSFFAHWEQQWEKINLIQMNVDPSVVKGL